MTGEPIYRLFFLQGDANFPDGTLFQLAAANTVVIPDRGDGVPFEVPAESLIECPPFAENLPPAQCPVIITSISEGNLSDTSVDQTIHYQVIILPLPPGTDGVTGVAVNDRIKNVEADHYEAAQVEIIDERPAYRLHIGHLRPGFYEAIADVANVPALRVTFIKFFPKTFSDRYQTITGKAPSYADAARYGIATTPVMKELYSDNGKFSDDLLNKAFELVTEWGENFCKPINERVLRFYPQLTDAEIAELTKLAREAETFIYGLAEQELAGKITENEIVPAACRRYRWLNDENSSRSKNIGMYYARR